MSTTLIIAFVAACIVLAVTPGPNMSLIVANTLTSGLGAGLATLAGSGTGLAILVTLAAIGMSSVMTFMGAWFDVVRWVGALYLVYLGTRQLWGWWRRRSLGSVPDKSSRGGWYMQGLLVSLSNPKVLLFIGAFLPQFIEPAHDPAPQLVVLAILFVVTLVLVDAAYTLTVAKARAAIDARKLRMLDGLAGGLLIAGGLVLATARRP